MRSMSETRTDMYIEVFSLILADDPVFRSCDSAPHPRCQLASPVDSFYASNLRSPNSGRKSENTKILDVQLKMGHKKPNGEHLRQVRFAGLNFSHKTVYRPALPSTAEAMEQTSLQAFGFIPVNASTKGIGTKPANKKRKTEPQGSSESNPDAEWLPHSRETTKNDYVRKRRKVCITFDQKGGNRSLSLQKEPAANIGYLRRYTDNYEVGETQFAQPWSSPCRKEDNEPLQTIAPLTPSSVPNPSPSKVTTEMLAPPITPRHRKLQEIPSSHSPPVTPLTPYVPQNSSRNSPPESPLAARKQRQIRTNRESIVSSQWWENEESTPVSPPETPFLWLHDKAKEAICGQQIPLKRGFSRISPVTKRTAPQGNDLPVIAEDSIASEDEYGDMVETVDGYKVTLFDQAEDNKMYHIARSKLTPQKRRPNQIRSPSPFETPWKSNQEDQLKSEKSNRLLKRNHDQDLPSSPPCFKARTTQQHPQETTGDTQYEGCDLSYDDWDIYGDVVESKEEKGKKSDNQVIENKKTYEEDIGYIKEEEREVTMSQLLPETLMESFPMPPPLTQTSSMPNCMFSDA